MKHILHLITNAVEPTLQATVQSQSERTDLRVTIVTTQNLTDTIVASETPIFLLPDVEGREFDSSPPMTAPRVIGYDLLMDLIFEADAIVTW
jgi:hypothetical protein